MRDFRQRKQFAFVVRQLTAREIKRKYARSYLGIVWSVLNPLLSMAVLSLIFPSCFGVPSITIPFIISPAIFCGRPSQGPPTPL